jgi:hypothetical protein
LATTGAVFATVTRKRIFATTRGSMFAICRSVVIAVPGFQTPHYEALLDPLPDTLTEPITLKIVQT